ncbi:MAG: hypothetical protein BWY57_02915 [Betaproteobacteria bacterium ADurb.Bin341]|nr:MAG: hypothetical protein BWY57_02915 [Betaproteobacteria bacterium ADurb.Bin341]
MVDANPTAVHSLADLKANPLTGVAEVTGNAGTFMGSMLGARALGMGITAASPLAGPAAPLIAGLGQAVSWAGPAAAAALPSFGGIREKQIQDDPTQQDSVGSKLLAAAGAGTVGLIESKLGPNKWAEMALSKQGRDALAEKFVANSLAGSIAKGAAKGAAIEGAEELAQNPIEQLASYQNPLTAENLKDTAFSGVMGALGGGVLGGASGAAFRGNPEKPGQNPDVTPGDQSIPYSPTTVEEVAKARAEAMGIKPENGPLSVASGMAIEGQTAEEMRLSTPGILAQGAAVAEQSRIEQEARQAADPGIPFEHVAADPLRDASIVPTVPVIDPQIPTQDWINQQTGVDQSSGVTRRDFEVAAKEQADPQIILDESGRPKTTASALEIQQFHADFDRREALRQRKLSAAERLRAARSRKNIVEAAQPDEVAQPAAPVVVDVAQPAITEDPPALGFTPQKPEPMRATADGQVGTPQQFDDLARTKATRKDQMRRAEDRVREMVQAGARMRGRDLVAPSGAVVMPNLTLLQAAKARQFTREAPNAQQDQSQPAPAQAVQAEAQGSQQQPAVDQPAQQEAQNVSTLRPATEGASEGSYPQGSVDARSVGNLRADRGSGTGGQAVRNDAAEPAASVPDSRAGGSGERVAEPVSAPYKLPLNLRDKNAALVEMASLTGKSDKEVRESFSAMWKREGRESAEKRLVATVERWRAEKSPEAKQSQSPTTSGNSAKNKETSIGGKEFVHEGVRIYPIHVKLGGTIRQMWGVESAENKRKRENGERYGAGDSLLDTEEKAKEEATRQSKNNKESEIQSRKELAEKASRAEQDERKKNDNINGFLDGKAENVKGLIRKALSKELRFDGVVMSIRDRIEGEQKNGNLFVSTFEEPRIKPMSRTQFNRADNREQAAHEKKMRDAGNKTVYLVGESDLGKTAYDYAKHLIENGRSNAPAAASNLQQKESPASVSTESNPASANQNPIKTETRANTGPEAEVASANKETRMTSQEWRDKGKSPSDLLNEKVDSLGRELAMTVAEEASQKDFAPNELATAVRMWADDGKVPADSLRIATLKHVSDFGLSDGRIKQIRAALNPLNAKNQEPTKLSVDLESLFADLDSSTVRKANKAKKAAKAHPLADKIQNVQDNFHDILTELEDKGLVKINCD